MSVDDATQDVTSATSEVWSNHIPAPGTPEGFTVRTTYPTNPDGVEVPSPHMHLYREGFGDKWAVPLPRDKFPNVADLWQMLDDFMRFCNVVDRPEIVKGLFS